MLMNSTSLLIEKDTYQPKNSYENVTNRSTAAIVMTSSLGFVIGQNFNTTFKTTFYQQFKVWGLSPLNYINLYILLFREALGEFWDS